jgi:phosphate transport system substrate-binding protein
MQRHARLAMLIFAASIIPFSTQAVTLNWAGCGITKKAFMAELATAYEKKTGTHVELEGGGATKGIRKIAAREVDFAGSCRFSVEQDAISNSQIQFNPVAWDALTVVVHKSNPIESISLEQLRSVFTGKITNWSQLGGADQPLELLIRKGKISGVGHTIRKLLFGDVDKDFVASASYKSSGPIEKAVEANPNAIAMTGISSARKRDFKIVNLAGKDPDYENIKGGKYLLYRPLYIVTNRQSENLSVVKSFLNFAHSREGREIIRKNGAVPYLEAVWLSGTLQQQWKQARKIQN